MELSVRKYEDPQRPKLKFVVYSPSANKKRKDRRFFSSRMAADRFVKEKQRELEALGLNAGTLDDETKLIVTRFQAKLPAGHTIEDAFKHYLKHLAQTQKSAPVKDIAAEFLKSAEKAGKSSKYRADLKSRLGAFVRDHGEKIASEVTPRLAAKWIAEREGSNVTRNHYRRVLSAFFTFCGQRGYVVESPIGRIPKSKPEPGATEIFTPGEMRHLLNASDGDVRAYLAIGGFAGLREAEIRRLQWEAFLWRADKIDLSAGVTKTAKRRLVEILPALAAWLTPYMTESGPVCKPGFDRRLRIFKKALPFAWKLNGLRHSFASYHLARWQDPGRVSLELGHANAGIVFSHYRELVDQDAAQIWWGGIRPEASNLVEFKKGTA